VTPFEEVLQAVRTYHKNEIAKLRKALTTDQAEWLDMFQTGLAMRRALKISCDGSGRCTCGICRAAWGWDHKYGVLTQFLHDTVEDFEDPEGRRSRPVNWDHPDHPAFVEESTF
jgi:hypothetical protein